MPGHFRTDSNIVRYVNGGCCSRLSISRVPEAGAGAPSCCASWLFFWLGQSRPDARPYATHTHALNPRISDPPPSAQHMMDQVLPNRMSIIGAQSARRRDSSTPCACVHFFLLRLASDSTPANSQRQRTKCRNPFRLLNFLSFAASGCSRSSCRISAPTQAKNHHANFQ